jgi:hypothetical protein
MIFYLSLFFFFYVSIVVWFVYEWKHVPMLSERCPVCDALGDVHNGDIFKCTECRYVWGL